MSANHVPPSPHSHIRIDPGASDRFVEAHDRDGVAAYLAKRRELDPKDLFLNDYFEAPFRPAP